MRSLALLLLAFPISVLAGGKFVPDKAKSRSSASLSIIQNRKSEIPELISFDKFRMLQPVARQKYLNMVARAVVKFEIAMNKKFAEQPVEKKKVRAEIETLREQIAFYASMVGEILLPSAEAATTCSVNYPLQFDGICGSYMVGAQCGPGELPRSSGGRWFCFKREEYLPYQQTHGMSPKPNFKIQQGDGKRLNSIAAQHIREYDHGQKMWGEGGAHDTARKQLATELKRQDAEELARNQPEADNRAHQQLAQIQRQRRENSEIAAQAEEAKQLRQQHAAANQPEEEDYEKGTRANERLAQTRRQQQAEVEAHAQAHEQKLLREQHVAANQPEEEDYEKGPRFNERLAQAQRQQQAEVEVAAQEEERRQLAEHRARGSAEAKVVQLPDEVKDEGEIRETSNHGPASARAEASVKQEKEPLPIEVADVAPAPQAPASLQDPGPKRVQTETVENDMELPPQIFKPGAPLGDVKTAKVQAGQFDQDNVLNLESKPGQPTGQLAASETASPPAVLAARPEPEQKLAPATAAAAPAPRVEQALSKPDPDSPLKASEIEKRRSDAKNFCGSLTKEEIKKARKDYVAALKKEGRGAKQCLTGLSKSEYEGGGRRSRLSYNRPDSWAGKCKPKKCTSEGYTGVQCNKAFFCDAEGKPVCARNGQETASTCWEISQANPENWNKDSKAPKVCNYLSSTDAKGKNKLDEAKQDVEVVQQVCNREGGADLFCYECRQVKDDLDAANKYAESQLANPMRTPTGNTKVIN